MVAKDIKQSLFTVVHKAIYTPNATILNILIIFTKKNPNIHKKPFDANTDLN